jgi:F0F1-type ATP synthase membrane subunit b/b'
MQNIILFIVVTIFSILLGNFLGDLLTKWLTKRWAKIDQRLREAENRALGIKTMAR